MRTPPIYIVAEHHEVLPFWAKSKANVVISFDFHTDTLPAFGRWIEQGGVAPVPSTHEADIMEHLKLLRHDEHFDYALSAGIVQKITLLSLVNFTETVPENLIMATPPAPQSERDVDLNAPEFFAYASGTLESNFLQQRLGDIPTEPYILDLDLDFFVANQQLNPADSTYFVQLFQQAEIITVSEEKIWVKLLSKPEDGLDCNKVWKKLQKLVEI